MAEPNPDDPLMADIVSKPATLYLILCFYTARFVALHEVCMKYWHNKLTGELIESKADMRTTTPVVYVMVALQQSTAISVSAARWRQTHFTFAGGWLLRF